MMNNNEKKIGFIGLGYWGKNILRNLYELGVLHTACDSNPAIISQRRKDFPDINFTASFDELINNPEIKAIVIASPAVTHYDLVKRSLLAGMDVFVEKPLALTVKEGEELESISRRENKILMVGHILQYHGAVIKLKELIISGELGKIQYIYSNRLNIGKLRTEENILWSFAPHDISIILMLLDEEPADVSAFGGDYLNRGVYDTTLTTLEFKNGVKGHIFVSWLHPFKEQKLIVVGTKAMAVFDDVSKEKLFIYPHTIKWESGRIPIAEKADYKAVSFENKEPLKSELQHFIECIEKRVQPQTDGAEGLRVLKVLELAERSFKNGYINREQSPVNYFIHETSYVDIDAVIGEGTKIWYFSHVLKGARIGKNCVIAQSVEIGQDVTIGDRCKIQNNVSVYKCVTLEDEVFCGPSCVFTNVYNPRAFIERKHEFRHTLVKQGATIGANATIIGGVTIGRYALIGAGAVVRTDVMDYALVVGVPARHIGWVCRCGVRLKFNGHAALCDNCKGEYILKDNKVEQKI